MAALVAVASLGGIFDPSTYARETVTWAAQGTGQDWVNLVVVAPWLAIAGRPAQRGSVMGRLLFGGALVYTAYSFAIYAFAIHFNRLFLVYCGALGLSCFALAQLAASFLRTGTGGWLVRRAPARAGGILLTSIAVLFAGLWLAEVVPAIARGTTPASVTEAGLLVNPVHVLDLAVALPAMLIAGVALWRRHPLGVVLGPILLTFSGLMTTAIGGMLAVMHHRGVPVAWPIAALLGVLTLASTLVLSALLPRPRFSILDDEVVAAPPVRS